MIKPRAKAGSGRLLLLWFMMLGAQVCSAQEHLEPARDPARFPTAVRQYYERLLPLLYKGFRPKPYARFAVVPSFDVEYAFSAEQIDGKYYIVSNTLSGQLWSAGSKKITVNTAKAVISGDMYDDIGLLYTLLASQTRPEAQRRQGKDGVTYYFSSTASGKVATGEIWTPDDGTVIARVVKVCNDLYDHGRGKGLPVNELQDELRQVLWLLSK